MPEKQVMKRAAKDKRQGKAASTQAGEFVREEFRHVREGKHGARSAKQVIAIGLSKARRAGVDLRPPKKGKTSEKTRTSAMHAWQEGQKGGHHKVSRRRSQAIHRALEHEGHQAGTHKAIAKQAHAAAMRRTAAERSAAAEKAVRTKGHAGLARAAKKAARTRASHSA